MAKYSCAHIRWKMAVVDGHNRYSRRFTKSVLVLGQIGCGKTTLVQNLAKNIMFGNIKKAEWISKIYLSKKREGTLKFHYPEDVAESNLLLEKLQDKNIANK